MSLDYFIALEGDPPDVAKLAEQLADVGPVSGSWQAGVLAPGVSLSVRAQSEDELALVAQALAGAGKPPMVVKTVIVLNTRSLDAMTDVAGAVLALSKGVVVDEEGELAPVGPRERQQVPPLDFSIPPAVEQSLASGRETYTIAARELTSKLPRFPAMVKKSPVSPKGKVATSRHGLWEENFIGAVKLKVIAKRELGWYERELTPLGLAGKIENVYRITVGPPPAEDADWRAMLHVACAIARLTRGVLYRPDGKVQHDFAAGTS